MDSASKSSTSQMMEPIGFLGLGVMGQPMALNLARAGMELVVWNRSPDAAEPLRKAGAKVAATVEDVFQQTRIVFAMLVNEDALDSVLRRGSPQFAALVADHTIVSMGSNSPEYSRSLASEIAAVGGRYVEAPVSGSRKPAEEGRLVAMLGGEPDTVSAIRPLLTPMCCETVLCGAVGHALLMKLTVNLCLNVMLAGLAEAVHFADQHGLDLAKLQQTIDSGPMDCDFTRVKLPKFIARDFSVQAATADAYNSTKLITASARAAGIASPLLDVSCSLYGESVSGGNGRLDMSSVITAIEAHTRRVKAGAK